MPLSHSGVLVIFMSFAVLPGGLPVFAQAVQQDGMPTPGADPSPVQPVIPQPPQPPPVQAPEDKRVFGVFPNNRTTENAIPFHSITAKQKVTIAFKDSFDWPVFPTSAAFAALYQIENQNPSFGQGMQGYAKRFATAYGDQMIGNMMTEGFVPAIFHQDPRYFRLGEGTKLHRVLYALEAIEVARMDSGRRTFNFSEWGGNAAAVAISNAYYPDTRDWSDNLQRLLVACGTDAFSNVLKEFWPDVKRKLHRHRDQEPLVSTGFR
jgi:hypothetical protein